MFLWFVFVSGKVANVLKCCFFCFLGWVILDYLGLEGLGVFVFFAVVFLFCVEFVFVAFVLFLFALLLGGVFGVLGVCCFCVFGFVSFCFVFVSS